MSGSNSRIHVGTAASPTLLFKIYKAFLCLISINIFIVGALVVVTQQLLANVFLSKIPQLNQLILDDSKKKFIVLLVTIFKINTPNSKIRITIPKIVNEKYKIIKKELKHKHLSSAVTAATNFRENSVAIANHQIYTDWVYLWWLAYTSNLGGRIYILLKKSLESIPLLGYGMRNYKFIFMSRKWELDKVNLHNHLKEINLNSQGKGRLSGRKPVTATINGEYIWSNDESAVEKDENKKWPYQVILFPEGTNLSANTKNKSAEYAKKTDKSPFSNVLLPHVTGVYEILTNLDTCKTLYDLTIGYSGVLQHEFAQDIYTIKSVFLEGNSPDIVDIHIAGVDRAEIPLENVAVFGEWLFKRWALKDDLMNTYYSNNGDFKTSETANNFDTYLFNCTCSYTDYLSILIAPLLCFYITLKCFIKWFF